ncbi:L-threonine ammonia-lyase [Salsuginibacillus halophilus]|uniref:threonine ammonia-lyase n=1 Tax=Salsuginibacillus halophilus TaxID=517424 RepID=A0A2P8HI20_9BACI|nr:pyridoxal-phosphate dependent enzyme [Salsuginibacillus halophilus]PSL45849.1 L-threonine ammonia-lyase [Salsuginibacillus halophilus]
MQARSVFEAAARIRSGVLYSPLIYSQTLSEAGGQPVYLKLEQLQPSGSFKLRGAMNFIRSLSNEAQKAGVTTFSTGNHGMAVAYAAAQLGIPAVICVSKHVPKAKVDILEKSGARIHIEGETQDEAGEISAAYASEGMTVVPPFDHPAIIAGQGTIGLEMIETRPEIEHIIAGLSGGGLLAGIGLFAKSVDENLRVSGISVMKGAAMDDSLRAGYPVAVDEPPTYADSLLGGIGEHNHYTMPLVGRYVDERIRLAEEDIARGMASLYEAHGLLVEGAAAVGAGAILSGAVQLKGPAAIVVTGAGISTSDHRQAVQPFI